MSHQRDMLSWGLVLFVLLLVAGAAYYLLLPQLQPHVTLRLGAGVFTAQVADTQEKRDQGLSGTYGLRDGQAMIFVFDGDAKWSVWMKDMRYSIDIVWLDKDKKVVYIVKNAPPESYPYESFAPKQDARYVVELAAGTVGPKKITIGAVAEFDEHNLEGWWR